MCQAVFIQWEAEIGGHVRLRDEAGSLPVNGTRIDWTLGNRLSGTVWSNTEGYYNIYVKTSTFSDSERQQVLTITPSLTSGSVQHEFLCDKIIKCTNRSVVLTHLQFADKTTPVDFIDKTSVLFKGFVYIGDTQTVVSNTPCPLVGAKVCLREVETGRDVNCALTDGVKEFGAYVLQVSIGLRVVVNVTYNGIRHRQFIFRPSAALSILPDYFLIEAAKSYDDINFEDKTKQTLEIQLAGGKCNRTLDSADFRYMPALCPGTIITKDRHHYQHHHRKRSCLCSLFLLCINWIDHSTAHFSTSITSLTTRHTNQSR
jgi:hypothetical protein